MILYYNAFDIWFIS